MNAKVLYCMAVGITILFIANKSYAQQGQSDAANVKAVQAAKTLTGWDILSNAYQLSLNDVTATSKAVSFKSTIFGLIKNFDTLVNNTPAYRKLWWARYTQPYLNYDYKNNFKPSNLSFGVTFSFINANDITRTPVFNRYNSKLSNEINLIDASLDKLITSLTLANPKNLKALEKQLAKFGISGKDADLTSELKSYLPPDLIKQFKDLTGDYDKLALTVSNRWNITFTPEISYAFNESSVQGYSFLFNAVRGFNILPKCTTQLTLKAGYVIGDDTIIKVTDVAKHQWENQIGFNQVLAQKKIKGNETPCAELAIAYGYNYLTAGYTVGQQRRQQSLSAKFGVLLGSSSWVVLPVTYNYATKKAMASVSLKVNLGDPPFKSKNTASQ